MINFQKTLYPVEFFRSNLVSARKRQFWYIICSSGHER